MAFHVYDGRRVVYETLDDARAHAQAAIDECRKLATPYEWPDEVSEIAVYEAPDDCGEPWRDGTLVLEARERVVEYEDHPLGKFSEFDLVEVRPTPAPVPLGSWALENISVGTRAFDIQSIDLSYASTPITGLPESADIFLRLSGTDTFIVYGRGRLTASDDSIAIAMFDPLSGEHRPLIRDSVLDVMIRANVPYGPSPVILLENAMFRSSPAKGTASIERSSPTDTFELVVADCLPDDDDGSEEPGAMCKRALAKAEANVDRRRQITKWALNEVVGGRIGFGIEPGANGLWHVLMQDGSLAFTLSEDVLPAQPGAAKKVVGALYTAWMNGVHGERARTATRTPDTITLTRGQLTSALRAAAAKGTDVSCWSSETAGAVREISEFLLESIQIGRRIGDEYETLVDEEKRAAR